MFIVGLEKESPHHFYHQRQLCDYNKISPTVLHLQTFPMTCFQMTRYTRSGLSNVNPTYATISWPQIHSQSTKHLGQQMFGTLQPGPVFFILTLYQNINVTKNKTNEYNSLIWSFRAEADQPLISPSVPLSLTHTHFLQKICTSLYQTNKTHRGIQKQTQSLLEYFKSWDNSQVHPCC